MTKPSINKPAASPQKFSSRRATLEERGYHMSELDQQQLQDEAAGKFGRMKHLLAAAQERVNETGAAIEAFGKDFHKDAANLEIGHQPWLADGFLAALQADLEKARKEVEAARKNAVSLGAPIEP